MWVRGLKQRRWPRQWRERRSHPMWVRGLKLGVLPVVLEGERVAPYVGAWIETEILEVS